MSGDAYVLAKDLEEFKNLNTQESISALTESLQGDLEHARFIIDKSIKFRSGIPVEDLIPKDQINLYLKAWLIRVKNKIK